MLARKSVTQTFTPDEHTRQLMEAFRRMTNDCIRIGLEQGKTSLKSLPLSCYPELRSYKLPSAYKLCAISKAAGILTHYRKLSKIHHHVRRPYCTRPTLTTCYGLKVQNGRLRMPGEIEVALNHYTRRSLSQLDIETRSATLTQHSLSVSVRKRVEEIGCTGMLGLDRNLDNVTLADSGNRVERCDLSRATNVKGRCRQVKAGFSRNDVRLRRSVFNKYGRLERARVGWLLHNVSANIVLQAKLNNQAIVMEDLRGIRKLYRKGNRQGTSYRSRMNSWSHGELQRQVQYNAEWNGIPVIYVRTHGTSEVFDVWAPRVA